MVKHLLSLQELLHAYQRAWRRTGAWLVLVVLLVAGSAAQGQQTPKDNANRLVNEASRLYDEGSKESLIAALQKLERALPLYRADAARPGEATTLTIMGRIYDDLGEKQKALASYAQALSILQTIGDRIGETAVLGNIGAVYLTIGEPQKALKHFTQALSVSRAGNDRINEANMLSNIGATYRQLGEMREALKYFTQSLPILHTLGNLRSTEAITLNNIGDIYTAIGEQQKALEYFLQALSLFRSVHERNLEVKGEGLVGLTRGFMYAGAPRVVVSLWSVNDAATAELMTRFYRGMLADKLRPAQALQAAQVSLLNDKRFAAPFYWAAFTLQGEWR